MDLQHQALGANATLGDCQLFTAELQNKLNAAFPVQPGDDEPVTMDSLARALNDFVPELEPEPEPIAVPLMHTAAADEASIPVEQPEVAGALVVIEEDVLQETTDAQQSAHANHAVLNGANARPDIQQRLISIVKTMLANTKRRVLNEFAEVENQIENIISLLS